MARDGYPAGLVSSSPSASSRGSSVLSRHFRRRFLENLVTAHDAGRLRFFGDHAPQPERDAFTAYLVPLRKSEWVVYSKRPFGGSGAVLAYLFRYTHRVAIANSRLIAFDDTGVTFKWKDYRAKGHEHFKVTTLIVDEFIGRFLLHALSGAFHRIRHYGLFADGARAENIARAHQLLNAPAIERETGDRHADGIDSGEAQELSQPAAAAVGSG